MKKKLTMLAALVLVFALGVTGTLAYLTASTQTVTNTFTVGNVKIELTETGATEANEYKNSYTMVPGNEITKDPKVTVLEGSEACWLFVKVEPSTNYAQFMTHAMADGWTQLKKNGVDVPYVFYYTGTITNGTAISVLAGDQVTVLDSVTQGMMDDISDPNKNVDEPTLAITAYAVQQANLTTAEQAWNVANGLNPDGTTKS